MSCRGLSRRGPFQSKYNKFMRKLPCRYEIHIAGTVFLFWLGTHVLYGTKNKNTRSCCCT